MIGRNGERRSGISAQAARHDDDIYIYIYIYIYEHKMLKEQHFIPSKFYFSFHNMSNLYMVIYLLLLTQNFALTGVK